MMANENEEMMVFKNAIECIIKFLKERSVPKEVYYFSPQLDLTKHAWHLGIKSKTIYSGIIEFLDEIQELEPVKRCLELMLEKDFPKHLEMRITDKEGRLVENPDYRPFLISEILGDLVDKYLNSYGFDFKEDNFKELYKEMTEYVYSKTRKLVVVSPLENFELCDINEVSINNYRVRELTEWEMQEFITHGYSLGYMFEIDFGSIKTKYCVETLLNVPKRQIPPLESYIEDFISVLRLFKPGYIEHGPILRYPKVWRTSWSMSLGRKSLDLSFPRYILSKEEVNSLSLLMEQYLNLKHHFPNQVRLAIRWFNKSYQETDIMDKLLDLAIALEVLFGSSDRLDLYIPRFIGSNREEKSRLNKDIGQLRKIRGSIVHSGFSEIDKEYISVIENTLRRCVLKIINALYSGSTYESIMSNIKESLLG